MMGRMLVWFSSTLAVLAAIACFVAVGPIIEARLFPVIDIHLEGETPGSPPYLKNNRLYFYITGPKARACRLDSLTFAWFFDHSAEFVEGYDEIAHHVYQPLVNRPAGGRVFRTPLISVEISKIALSHHEVLFDASFYHDCNRVLWLVNRHVSLTLNIEAPPKGKSEFTITVAGQEQGP